MGRAEVDGDVKHVFDGRDSLDVEEVEDEEVDVELDVDEEVDEDVVEVDVLDDDDVDEVDVDVEARRSKIISSSLSLRKMGSNLLH